MAVCLIVSAITLAAVPGPSDAAVARTSPAAKAEPDAAARIKSATEVLTRKRLLKPGQTVVKAEDHEVIIADSSTQAYAMDTDVSSGQIAPMGVVGDGYVLSVGPGLLSHYTVRPVPGTPQWIVNDVMSAARAAGPYARTSYVLGGAPTRRVPAHGEVFVALSDDNPCSADGSLVAGCTVKWYSGRVTSAIIYATSFSLTYSLARCAMVHEVGHALGLSHVDDRSQVMYPLMVGVCDYQWGDQAGLAAMGSVITPSGPPVGFLDTVTAVTGGVRMTGWAADPDQPLAPLYVQLSVAGRSATVIARQTRSDVGSAYPQYGTDHGFSDLLSGLQAGTYSACATAINVGPGQDTPLGCLTVTVTSGFPAVPDTPTLEVGNGSVVVRASAAVANGVTYTATLGDLDGRKIATCQITAGTSCSISGLASGSYQANLTARNQYGTSDASPRSAPVSVGPSSAFTPVSPTRVLDSRNGTGISTYTTPWGPQAQRSVTVTGTFGDAVIPADATAVVVNLTTTNTTGASFAALWPAGALRPGASALNWGPGETVANHVTVPVGNGGQLALFNNAGSADFILDVVGYYRGTGTGSPFTAASVPTRILDSRIGTGAQRYTTPWQAGTSRAVSVTGAFGAVTVPTNATAVVVNLTTTATTSGSFAAMWPAGQSRPNVSSLNWPAGDTRANLVTVPVGANGQVMLYNNAGQAHFVMDVVGWYTPASTERLRAVQPTRAADTRTGLGSIARPLGSGECRDFRVTERIGTGSDVAWVPTAATSVVANVTVTDTTDWSFLTVFPTGKAKPLASTQNWGPGATRPAAVEVAIGSGGSVTVCNERGQASVIIDISGYRTTD